MKSDYSGTFDQLDPDYFEANLPPRSKFGSSRDFGLDSEQITSLKSNTLNHSILQAFGSCQLKGTLLVGNNPALHPTTFAQAHMRSGTRFETEAVANFALWHDKLSTCGISCPCLPAETLEGYSHREQEASFDIQLKTIKTGEPRLFVQVPVRLANGEKISGIPGIALEGVIDVLIWTGEKWLIGDTKCAESAQTSYGNQVSLYAKIWESKFPDQPLHPVGFIAHCGEGNLFSLHASTSARHRALRNMTVTPIEYSLYEISLRQAFAHYNAPCPEPSFKPHCIECQFRYHCYRQMLLERTSTNISFFPNLGTSDVVLLRNDGVDTVEELLKRFEQGTGHDLVGSSADMLPYLRGRAEAVIRFKGFSSLVLPEDMLDQSAFVAYSPEEETNMVGVIDRLTRQPVRTPLTKVSEEWFAQHLGARNPGYVVSYTPHEANCAYHIEGGVLNRLRGRRVAVLELLRDDVHLPFPSYGLPEVAKLLEYTVNLDTATGIRAWHNRIQMEDPEEKKFRVKGLTGTDQLSYLEMTVYALLKFGEMCRKEELKYVQ